LTDERAPQRGHETDWLPGMLVMRGP
jgi:hypothetical protein